MVLFVTTTTSVIDTLGVLDKHYQRVDCEDMVVRVCNSEISYNLIEILLEFETLEILL